MLKLGGIYKDKKNADTCFVIINIYKEDKDFTCVGIDIENIKSFIFSKKIILNKLKNMKNYEYSWFHNTVEDIEFEFVDGYLGQIDDELLKFLQKKYQIKL